MSTTDGNSTTRPLRRRKSKRFDRSGGSPLASGSTVIDADSDVGDDAHDVGDDVELDFPEAEAETSEPDPAAAANAADPDEGSEADGSAGASDPDEATSTPVATPSTTTVAAEDGTQSARTDPTGRGRTLDQMAPCGRCGHDVSTVHIEVDGNVLLMESCDNCDTRRWQLAGKPIELQQALDHVGEHSGRRR